MSDQSSSSQPPEPKTRSVGGTEYSWCKAVPGGTGITVLALHLSKPPDLSLLQNALHKLQLSHPNLRSKLHFDPTANTFSFITPSAAHLQIQLHDLSSTADVIHSLSDPTVSPFQLIIEHEMNTNAWINHDGSVNTDADVFFASVYAMSDDKWVVVLRIHTAACDRTAALRSLKELLGLMRREGGGTEGELKEEWEISLGIEECIPSGKANKPFWARGVDMLGYSLNSLRLANLDFKNTELSRSSQFVRLKMNSDETNRILSVSAYLIHSPTLVLITI